MNCPKCGALLEEDSKFCTSCGANLEPNQEVEKIESSNFPNGEEHKVEKESKITKIPSKKIGLIVGTVLVIIGFIRIFSAGTSISSTSFGGDFYTYTYQGIVAISEILASIEVTLGWVVVAIGAGIDVISLKQEG